MTEPIEMSHCCNASAPVPILRAGRVRVAVEPLERRTLFAAVTFTLDPVLSTLRLSGEVASVIDLEEQHSGSLSAAYEGTIQVDLDTNALAFMGGSRIVAQSKGKYDPGNAAANYGGEGETGGFLGIKVGDAAVRGLKLDITSSEIALGNDGSFPANSVTLETTAGELEYDLRVGGESEIDLDGQRLRNSHSGTATITGSGDDRTLTIPIDITLDEDNAELRLRGKLVAGIGSGGPGAGAGSVKIGQGGAKGVAFIDADGTTAAIALRGGSGNVTFNNAASQVTTSRGVVVVRGAGVSLSGITVEGATAASRLVMRGSGGADGTFDVPAVTVDGSLLALGGAGVNFTGAVSIDGAVANIAASDLTGATVTATSIGKMSVGTDVTDSTITLSAPYAAGTTALAQLAVRGAMTGSRVSAAGSMGVVKITTLTDSEIYSGVTGPDRFPSATASLPTEAGITKLVVRSISNSVVAANNIGKVALGVIRTDNDEEPFGIVGDSILRLQATNGRQRLRLGTLETQADLTAALQGKNFAFGDFQIRLV